MASWQLQGGQPQPEVSIIPNQDKLHVKIDLWRPWGHLGDLQE